MAARVCSVSRGVFSCPVLPSLRTICSLFRRQGTLRNPYNVTQYVSCEDYTMCSTRFNNKRPRAHLILPRNVTGISTHCRHGQLKLASK